GRAAQGVRLINLKDGDKIASVAIVPASEDPDELIEIVPTSEGPDDLTELPEGIINDQPVSPESTE
ncbi:MAG: DNA gyrase C-terminal beta-propeller domain-containing protein, partial [Bacteroidota bacterium]|nr:DNA gyrase C-terminal beta-propeller domain-containing protein [Bacteroidota bacterium]